MKIVSLTRTPGITVYAFPDRASGYSLADWTTHRVQLTEGTGANAGHYTGSLDETKSQLWWAFEGSSQPTDWDDQIAYFPLANQTALDVLLSRTDAAVTVTVVAPVSESGQLTELIIGDDYLAANSRALVWSIPEITGMSVANATAVFGLRKGEVSVTVNGTVATGDAGEWDVTTEIARTAWGELTEGLAEYSLEIRDSSNGREVTRVINRKDCLVRLRRKAT
jgi:hypothetical protein